MRTMQNVSKSRLAYPGLLMYGGHEGRPMRRSDDFQMCLESFDINAFRRPLFDLAMLRRSHGDR